LQKNRINSKSLYEDLRAQHLSMFCANQIGGQFVFGSKTQKLRQTCSSPPVELSSWCAMLKPVQAWVF
jgi:hypothetical protein